jgi:ribonuclease HI
MMSKHNITIYTDGACDPNPGPGGWAAILRAGRHEKVISGGEPKTTNNRMELKAALSALRALKSSCHVTLHTDSEYLRRGITEWFPAWERREWRTSDGRPVHNQDLWQALADQVKRHQVTWRWVRGHAGDPLNERVDRLARAAIPRRASRRALDGSVQLFTRASCLGKGGYGGWAIVKRRGSHVKSLSGSATGTTANAMELQAAIRGLASLTAPSQVQVCTVSQYLHQGITRWVANWQARDWLTKVGQPVRHKALWMALQEAMSPHQVEWELLGSADRPVESEQAAKLAAQAARAAQGEPDEV